MFSSDFENTSVNMSPDLLQNLMASHVRPNPRRTRPTSLQASVSSNSEVSSGVRSGNQSAATSPELPRVSNGASKVKHPPLTRSRTENTNFDPSQKRSTPRSSISSASSSSVSLSPVETRGDLSQRARDLLDLFATDATRQTPLPAPRNSTVTSTMPNHDPKSTSGIVQSPEADAATFMAAFQQPGNQERSPISNAPPNIGFYHSVGPSGSLPYPGMMGSFPYGTRPPVGMHMNINQHSRMPPNAHPSLSYPVQSFPYRPSSVPLHEPTTHSQAPTPTQAIPGQSFHNLPQIHSFNAPSGPNSGIRKPPASGPRNVPHAQQLLALFHDSPSVS